MVAQNLAIPPFTLTPCENTEPLIRDPFIPSSALSFGTESRDPQIRPSKRERGKSVKERKVREEEEVKGRLQNQDRGHTNTGWIK